MAYVSVAEWRPEQVTEWLKGLDNSIVSYIHWFSNNEINGQQLLNISPDELTHLGVYKLGHQELILEAVQHLRNFHYELDRENLQLLALKLSCASHSLFSEIRDQAESSSVPTQLMADVANVIHNVKPLVSWLDRPPFAGQIQYGEFKTQLLSLSLEMATCAQRDRFAEKPVAKIRTCSSKLAKLADSIIQDVTDPIILQPATLDLATIKKKAGEDLDFFLVPSFHGIHQIGDMKLSSPAHQSGKIQQGDEIVQVNYQTVVGWSRKKVLALFEESPNDLLITLKRRPRHVKMYGQIYMKPYRLPSRKRALPYSRWNDNLPSPRPELLTIPHFDITSRTVNLPKKVEKSQTLALEPSGTSSSSDEEFGQPSYSQSSVSMRLYLPKPRAPIQRRFTLSGPPRPSAQSEQFWRELQLERSWRSNQNNSQVNNSCAQNVGGKESKIDEMFQLRDKSASLGNSIASASSCSTTCVSFSKIRVESVKFDLAKFDSTKNDSYGSDKTMSGERDTKITDISSKAPASEDNRSKIVSSKEAEQNKMLNSNGCESLSISELNKLKRNAFFNNMECQNAQGELVSKCEVEGSSEKVRRVIENFKMEINKTKKDMSEVDLKSPGKVMELIENFEKVKNQGFVQTEKFTPTKTAKERSRLDKSCSTPAYDTTESDFAEREMDFIKFSQKNYAQKDASEYNQKNKFDFSNLITKENNKKDSENENYDNESNACLKVGAAFEKNISSEKEVFENKNDDSVETQFENENGFYFKDREKPNCLNLNANTAENLQLSKKVKQTNQLSSDFSSTSSSTPIDKNEEIKPIPAQRKSKLPPKVNQNISPPCPLPPKPVSKLLPISPEEIRITNSQMPPELPPRSESSVSKSSSKKLDLYDRKSQEGDCHSRRGSVVDASEPGVSLGRNNIIISPPIPSPPGLQSTLNEFKPLSAVSQSGRKISKTLNALVSPTTVLSAEKEKPKASGSTLESLKAILILGKKTSSVNSPRSIRKKNAMLAKKRNVGVKEFTAFENSGFLWYRNRKGTAAASWIRYYFILQGSNFYGFRSKESHKADLFIHLTGFTCTPAEEVKSREFSFKIYHTGTVFYFAANSKEDFQQWLDSVNLAISFQDDKFLPEAVTYSQTDSDSSEAELEAEICFPTSPKMKKVLGSSPPPVPARSHQNLASDSKKIHDSPKRFGSLKKLNPQKNPASNSLFSAGNESSEVTSLDRKYLKFLSKNSPTPVPTSRFRSYRRMQPPPVIPPKGKFKSKPKNFETNTENEILPINNPKSSQLKRKPLHSSNPSLINLDMADYRITQERLAEFRRLRNQNTAPNQNRFMTLEQFLQNRENFRTGRGRPPDLSNLMTLEQFLLSQAEGRQPSLRPRDRQAPVNEYSTGEQIENEDVRYKSNLQNKLKVHPKSDRQCQSISSRTNKTEFKILPRNRTYATSSSEKLKNISTLQPSCTPHSASTSNQGMESSITGIKQNEVKKQHLGNSSKTSKCNHTANVELPDYQGIEYPPAFEPETYTLQHMLKNRKKRDSEHKNK